MPNLRKNMKRVAIAAVIIGVISASGARAEEPKPPESTVGGMHIIDRTLAMPVGGTEIVALPPNLQTASISLPDVVHVNLVSQKVAEILAHHDGQTDVLFTGKDTIYRFHVTVKRPAR